MEAYVAEMQKYWNDRFANEGRIWGCTPSSTAFHALDFFQTQKTKTLLVPGSGYGRNSKLFSHAGFDVTGIEISNDAVALARQYDPKSTFFCASFLEMPLEKCSFDAIYCFNVLHLFRQNDRHLFVEKCFQVLKNPGFAFFAVFSDTEKSFGKGEQVEENTFESKPGRPVHYFTAQDLKDHFCKFTLLETDIAEDLENHGEEGPHAHLVRYIIVKKG